MFVHFVTIQTQSGSGNFKDFYKELGNDIPNYLELEGGDGTGGLYLFCINKDEPYDLLIDKYKFRKSSPNLVEIKDIKYSFQYRVSLKTGMNIHSSHRLELNNGKWNSDSDDEC